MAAKRSSKAAKAEPGVITIELTPEQQAEIKRQSKGQLSISTLKLRPELNLRLQELSKTLGAGLRIRQTVANGPNEYWV